MAIPDAPLPKKQPPKRPRVLPAQYQILPQTHFSTDITNPRILVAADAIGLISDANRLGYTIMWRALADSMNQSAKQCDLRAVLACHEQEIIPFGSMLLDQGWIPCVMPSDIEPIAYGFGKMPTRTAFALCVIGWLLLSSKPDILIRLFG